MADYELVVSTVLQFPMSVSCQKNLAYKVLKSSAQGLLTDRAGGYVYDPQEQRAGLWFNLNKHIMKEMKISFSIWAKQRRLNAHKRQTLLRWW